MGYEVLDSDGPARLRLHATRPPDGTPTSAAGPWPDVYELLPAPAPSSPRGATGPRPGGWLGGRAPGPTHVLTRRRWLVVAGLLVTAGAFGGAVLGVMVGTNHAVQNQRDADRTTLAAVAYATEVTSYVGAGGNTALLRVRLTNAGPEAVDVVTTPFGAQSAPGRPVVRQYGRTPAVAPGTDLDVLMTVTVVCGEPATAVPRVPVRTADGLVHQVVVRSRTDELDLATSCPLRTPASR